MPSAHIQPAAKCFLVWDVIMKVIITSMTQFSVELNRRDKIFMCLTLPTKINVCFCNLTLIRPLRKIIYEDWENHPNSGIDDTKIQCWKNKKFR